MFYNARSIQPRHSGWDVSKVTDFVNYGTNASLMPNKFQENDLYGYFKYILDDGTLANAVSSWETDSTTAEQTYGPMSNWDVSQVTNMNSLFKDKTNIFGHKINFVNVQNLSVADSQSYMTTNFGNISPQFTMNGAAVSNNMSKDTNYYGLPSDGITIWE